MKHRFLIAFGGSLVFLILLGWGCSQSQQAQIQETQVSIKTYPYSDPDPVPILTRSSLWGRGARLYPYTFIDEYAHEAVDRDWTVVRLENPFIQVSLLPEVGGKIWGASEKSTGKEFIYTNHVLKFREIALRGPWTSGGVEFNFGIVGHTPSGAHPVDYLVQKNRDGSVSCIVGNMDLPSRSRWTVTVTVPPDSAYFETHSFWYNSSPLHQSYYVWMNGAIHISDDLEYVFPGRRHIAHDFAVPLRPWPVDEKGRNLAWYRNNDFGSYKSYFTVGEYEDFFGGYWHDSRFGFGHWAHYDDMPGHKIWIWGLSRQGMIWEDLLTDADGQYSEPQAGRYLNQNDHALFTPQGADRWHEIWFPYKDIGPMVKASPYAVVSAEVTGDHLDFGICSLQPLDDELKVLIAGQEIFRKRLRLAPMETFRQALSVKGDTEKIVLQLGDKLTYHTDPRANDLERPIHFQQYREDSPSQIFQRAELMFRERNYFQALEAYRNLVAQDPQHTVALSRIAELYLRRGENQLALDYARQALEISMYDPLANYVYAQVTRRLGKQIEALEALGWAARSLEYRSSAYGQMAELRMCAGSPLMALDYARRAIDYNTYNLNAYQTAAAAHRVLGEAAAARKVLAHIQAIDPLNHFSRFEAYLLSPSARTRERFQDMIRNEYPYETYLELALYYHSLGQDREAHELLSLAPEYPMVYYWLAYLDRDSLPEESRKYLDKANSLSALLVFPFREESIPVLRWAAARSTREWKTKYYLGLLLWSKGRAEEAQSLFMACGQPDFAPFYIARAYFFRETSPELALRDYQKGASLDRNSWRNLYRLLEFTRQQGIDDEALAQARVAAERFPESIPIRMELVRALVAQRLYQEAADLLENTDALPSEGATAIHELFETAHLQLALQYIQEDDLTRALEHLERSQEYPENLGSGRPYDPDLRLQEYLRALCHENLGEKEKALALYQTIYTYTLDHEGRDAPHAYFGGLVLLRRGERLKAGQLLRSAPPDAAVLRAIQKLQ